jgi:hypothetical protein
VKEDLIAVRKKNERVDAILLKYSIGIIRCLPLTFHGAAAAPLCLNNSKGAVSVVNQSVVSKLIAFSRYLSAQDILVHKTH